MNRERDAAASLHPFTRRVLAWIRAIPPGRVATYGQVAALAGNPRAARQVARVLHACTAGWDLPWHRVVNREGRISLVRPGGGDEQWRRLRAEGVEFDATERIDLARFLWLPDGSGPEVHDARDARDAREDRAVRGDPAVRDGR